MAEGARLESVFTRKGNVGSNPTLSASTLVISHLPRLLPHTRIGCRLFGGLLGDATGDSIRLLTSAVNGCRGNRCRAVTTGKSNVENQSCFWSRTIRNS